MGVAYYNEHDPAAAEWLVELIRAGLIAPGVVDDRDIQSIRENDLAAYTQVHLFAGIGGWSYALRLAGWPDDRRVWTGSCPCQPFSAAGKHKGTKDARHLWPWMRHLMFRRRPAIAFGEQVASADGRIWLSGVRANLETLGYVVGAADLCAAGIAAPHIRQRLFWVADSRYDLQPGPRQRRRMEKAKRRESRIDPESRGVACGLAHSASMPSAEHGLESGEGSRRQSPPENSADGRGLAVRMADAECKRTGPGVPREQRQAGCGRDRSSIDSPIMRLGNAIDAGLEGHAGNGNDGRESRRIETQPDRPASAAGTVGDFWGAFDRIPCRDGKTRRIEPGTFPLAHGIPDRVGLLRGYGNAIVPQLAANFIQAYCEIERLDMEASVAYDQAAMGAIAERLASEREKV